MADVETAHPQRSQACRAAYVRFAAVFLLAGFAYASTAWVFRHGHANPVYFDHLAAAFLAGRLDLPDPPGHHDLSPCDERWYVPFPPLPALLLLPWVAFAGVANVNAVYLSIALGSASVALVDALLESLRRRAWIETSAFAQALLVLLFAGGTVHWYVAVEGSVWFLSQTCAVFFTLLATFLAVQSKSPWPAGIALACAVLTRPNVVLLFALLAGIAAMRSAEPRGLARWALAALVPSLLAFAMLMAYNQARFHDPFDFGYTRQQVETSLLGPLFMSGQFSIDHVPRNLWFMLLEIPRSVRGQNGLQPSDMGMSALLTTPALLWLIFVRLRTPLAIGAALAATLTLLPLLMYYNTGWRQFGYRFLLDLTAPLLILLAIALGRAAPLRFRILVALSVLMNAWGVWWWFTTVSMPS